MPSPFLVPCLAVLRAEFNDIAPGRDRASDGWIGDKAHQAEPSEHNPDAAGRVHAIDVDDSGPWPDGWSMERMVQLLLNRQRARADDRLQNIIYNRRIWSRSWDWGQRPYTGPSPHTEHAHFSARHDATRDHIQPWGLYAAYEEESMPTAKEIVTELLNTDLGKPGGGDTVAMALQGALGNSARALTELAALKAAVADVDDQVIARLAGQSTDQVVAALRAALGDRATAVGRALAGA